MVRDSLCEMHVERRRAIGWRFGKDQPAAHSGVHCFDCDSKDSTILEARIAADDAAAKKAEPEPVKVLKGQKSLW
jgi:hypothetical protein